MSAIDTRQTTAQHRRLQLILLLAIAWELLVLAGELSFGGPLMKIDGDRVGGILAARASLSGAALMPIVMYLYAIARNPVRHRGVIWAAVVHQGAAALFAVYHVAAKDLNVEGMILPLAVSLLLLLALLVNMPRAHVMAQP